MALDLSSLRKAIVVLDGAIAVARDDAFMRPLDELKQNTIRAGVIQNFEFTFELCWKFIQRWLRLNRTSEEAEPLTRKDLFRLAARHGLIEDPLLWFEYADARNMTSHTYDDDKARQVFDSAKRFPADAKKLLERLEKAND